MNSSGFGEHEKLIIQPYSDKGFQPKDAVGEPFKATINPETYTTRHKIEFCETQAPGTSMPILKFNKITAQEISFDFLFDSTGVIKDATPLSIGIANPLSKPKSVADEIDAFRKKIIDYKKDIHRPYWLKIHWGTLLFKCVLTNLDIEYKLFKHDGTPIRAVAKCTFKGTVEEDLRNALEDKQSPDVTHERLVKSGDRLSVLAHKIYNQQNYLLPVAAYNRLDGFRNVKTGTKIYFPPVAK
jgi:nucleoid-associated protein YgaU